VHFKEGVASNCEFPQQKQNFVCCNFSVSAVLKDQQSPARPSTNEGGYSSTRTFGGQTSRKTTIKAQRIERSINKGIITKKKKIQFTHSDFFSKKIVGRFNSGAISQISHFLTWRDWVTANHS
jgi:hypothetical protein